MNKVFLFLVFLNSFISAQWPGVPKLPEQDFYAACFDGSNIYAGSDSLVFISSNGGDDWHSSVIMEGRPAGVTDMIKIDNAIYLGSYGDGVFRSSDNGASWQVLNNGLGSMAMSVVKFLRSGDSLFIGTDGGGIYFRDLKADTAWVSYNDGLGWRIAYSVKSLCRSGNNLIAAAGASGYYYVRPLNASEWTERTIHPVKVPNVNRFFTIGTIAGMGNTGSADTRSSDTRFSDTVFAATVRGIYRSTDSGMTWDSVGIYAMPIQPTHFAQYNGRIYAGYDRVSEFYLWFSDDMGKTWVSQDHQFMGLYNLYAHEGRLWAATNKGMFYNKAEVTGVGEGKGRVGDPGGVGSKGGNQERRGSGGGDIGYGMVKNYPNPFNPSTVIRFRLENEEDVRLTVHDLLGREVALLINGRLNKGVHNVNFDGAQLPSGVYICVLKAGSRNDVRQMVLLR